MRVIIGGVVSVILSPHGVGIQLLVQSDGRSLSVTLVLHIDFPSSHTTDDHIHCSHSTVSTVAAVLSVRVSESHPLLRRRQSVSLKHPGESLSCMSISKLPLYTSANSAASFHTNRYHKADIVTHHVKV